MKTIRRYFATLAAAERFHDTLYERYEHVRVTQTPMFTEEGYYAWEVK